MTRTTSTTTSRFVVFAAVFATVTSLGVSCGGKVETQDQVLDGGSPAQGGMGGKGGFGGSGGVLDASKPEATLPEAQSETTTSCKPTDVKQPYYVDPNSGVDDDAHGAAPGSCALRTLYYALKVASGEIHLAPATYDLQTVVVLSGSQQLVGDAASPAVLSGQPELASTHLAVKMSGNGNALRNCVIRGLDASGYCVDISGDNAIVENVHLSHCGGAAVRQLGSNGLYTGNTIEHDLAGLFFQESTSATINDNLFVAVVDWDVHCNTACKLAGKGNKRGALPAQCEPVCGCPVSFGSD